MLLIEFTFTKGADLRVTSNKILLIKDMSKSLIPFVDILIAKEIESLSQTLIF